jgi:hypothetical protein
MHCPYKHCESKDILQVFVTNGAKLIGSFYGTVQTTYYKCHGCGKYFKQVSFFATLGPTEKREVMTAEIKGMSALRDYSATSTRAI